MRFDAAHGLADFLMKQAKCAACDRRPERFWRVDKPGSMEVEMIFKCHGRIQELRLPVEVSLRPDLVAKVVDDVAKLFPYDAGPDMRELLRYNREGWCA